MDIVNKGEKGGVIRIEVTITPQEIQEESSQLYMGMAIQNDLHPMPGKTAYEVCVDALGEDVVYERTAVSLMGRFAPLALDQADVSIMGVPSYEPITPFVPNQPFVFYVQGVLIPHMTLSTYKPVVIDVEDETITDDEVDQQFSMLM